MKKIFILLSLILGLNSCSPSKSEYNKLLNEKKNLEENNKVLRDSIILLTKDIEGYRYTPDKLLMSAQNKFKDKNRNELNIILDQLYTYHPTSKEYKQVESMLVTLDKMIADKAKKEKAQRMRAVTKLRKKYDDVSGITWYYNPYFTHYTNSNLTSLYMGQKDNDVWLCLRMSYYGDDWIFFENAYLSYDGNTKEIIFDKYKDKETDSDTEVWEWIDVPVFDDLLKFLEEMSKGKVLKMRLSGKYTKTRSLSSKEINAMKDILLAYDVLRNEE
jgi:hypothetical protein